MKKKLFYLKKEINKFFMFSLLVLFLLLSFNANAKKELSYINLTPNIKSGVSKTVCIATLDKREVVTKGNQDARFVGYIRSAVGIAYPIKNGSDKNFSEVVSTTIANAFKNNGCTSKVIKTNHANSKEEVLEKLKKEKGDVLVLVSMNKWRTDTKTVSATKVATELIYDLVLTIYNESGELLATATLNKIEPKLAPAMSSGIKKIQKKVIDVKYPEVMTNLFSISEIEKVLK